MWALSLTTCTFAAFGGAGGDAMLLGVRLSGLKLSILYREIGRVGRSEAEE